MTKPATIIRRVEHDADREAASRIGHAANGPDLPFAYYCALRLRSPLLARGASWLLEADGQAVAALVCYALRFAASDGEVVAGYGFGSVCTTPDAQHLGYATQLCEAVAKDAESRGSPVGLLFTQVAPGFYERMGFRSCQAWNQWCDDPAQFADSGARAKLRTADPRRQAGALIDLHRELHAGRLHIARDEAWFAQSLVERANDVFFMVGDPARGYLRLERHEGGLDIVDSALAPGDYAPTLRAGAGLAKELGGKPLHGWLRPDPALLPWFVDRGRAATLPMLRGTNPQGAVFSRADYF